MESTKKYKLNVSETPEGFSAVGISGSDILDDYNKLPFEEKRVLDNYVDINGMPHAVYSKLFFISFLNGVTSLDTALLRKDQKIQGDVIKVTEVRNDFAFIPALTSTSPLESLVIVDGFEKGYLAIDGKGTITCGPNMPLNKPFKVSVKLEYAKWPVLY